MTTHQDNATRLARFAQILAVIGVIAAVASFYPVNLKEVASNARNPTNQGGATTGGPEGDKHFQVLKEDWLIALGPLSANHNPSSLNGGGPGGIGGPDDDDDDDDPEVIDDRPPSSKDRPPIRFLGSLEDPKGFAALIDFAGRQVLLRVGQEFEDDFEITAITENEIIVTDGFEEFTFEIAQSKLQDALPTQLPGSNPNAFPPGSRNPQGNPRNPGNLQNPRNPGKQDDDGGSPA